MSGKRGDWRSVDGVYAEYEYTRDLVMVYRAETPGVRWRIGGSVVIGYVPQVFVPRDGAGKEHVCKTVRLMGLG